MNAPDRAPLRLTQFSHGGGCGCKIAPAMLQQIIAKSGTSVLPAIAYAAMLASTTQLNTPGIAFANRAGVHALTDVTGFGLLGQLLEMCRASNAGATIDFDKVPLLPGVRELAATGLVTGASGRNWAGYGPDVALAGAQGDLARALLTDPQTSGGLLVACAPETVDTVLATFRDEGFDRATVIGEITPGAARVGVR